MPRRRRRRGCAPPAGRCARRSQYADWPPSFSAPPPSPSSPWRPAAVVRSTEPRSESTRLRRRLWRLGALAVAAVAASVVAAVLVPRLRAQLLPDGSAAPPFSLVGDDGQRHSLPRRATVLEFFETTCPHC